MIKNSQKVEFHDEHRPKLTDGNYKITVNQTISHTEKIKTGEGKFSTPEMTFSVIGERFHLNPQDIFAIFPPANSLGEHSNVLPHISLNRSTFPWERFAENDDSKQTPWLALLLFNTSESAQIEALESARGDGGNIPLSELEGSSRTSPYYFPGLALERWQKGTDRVSIIDVPKNILQKVLPTSAELKLLTHVRTATDDNAEPTGEEQAVIISNRLPAKRETSTVYLVSLENRFNNSNSFNYQSSTDPNSKIRLISLKSWKFSCPEHFKVTEEFLEHASDLETTIKTKLKNLHGEEFFTADSFDQRLGEVGITGDELKTNRKMIHTDFAYGDFANTLKHLNRTPSNLSLPVPDGMNHTNKTYLELGFVPTPHHLRKGAISVSWYHGPFVAGTTESNEVLTLPSSTADQLLRYYEDNGMLDISYAAAWELGRLLSLQDKDFSKRLFKWKRSHIHEIRKAEQALVHQSEHLNNSRDLSVFDLPKFVEKWFDELHLLKGIPFNYLVPREEMLPVESIRFFAVDPLWVESVVDGAFSVGRVISHDHKREKDHLHDKLKPMVNTTGFLLRSQVVSGWPGMQVEGLDSTSGQLDILRFERISEDVLLCLFHGELRTLDFHLKPEAMHFGLSVKESGYEKQLKKNDGGNIPETPGMSTKVNVTFRGNETDRVPDIASLLDSMIDTARSLPDITIAANRADQFALQMIEGAEKVQFILGTATQEILN